MNKELKENLRTAFDAPSPKMKNEFLLSVNFPKSTRFNFLLAQIGYIRKRVWAVTLLAAVPTLIILLSNLTENVLNYIWVVSSLFPFIVLSGVTEIARSASHNMAELELCCKYNFSNVVLARLVILGCANLSMFAAVIALFRMAGSVEILRLGTYLFVPFLLTCSLSLYSFNRLRSKESIYICGGISCLVSIINAFLSNRYSVAFSDEYIMIWGIALFVLLIWTAGEIIKLIRRMEEYQWNLSLTA